jgi:S1-C subfamily serine protease
LVCQSIFLGIQIQSVSARIWTDKNGRKIEAELKSVDALTITLENSSGKVVTIPLSSLSEVDRQWVSDLKEAEKKGFEQTKKEAEQGDAVAQFNLGLMYANGDGVPQDYKEVVKWYRLAADQGLAYAQFNLGLMYANGDGVPQDYKEVVKWWRLAAEQGHVKAQFNLGVAYRNGEGVPQDYVQSYAWFNLATASGYATAKYSKDLLTKKMTPHQIALGQELSRNLLTKPSTKPPARPPEEGGIASGTGWFTTTGHIVTCYHVIKGRANISYAFENGIKNKARVVLKDAINDIAILKPVENQKLPKGLPVARRTSIGTQVFTLGFPHVDLLGKSPKLTNGIISATTGLQDDPRALQISVPVQPGNSGGPLLNMRGEVVGIVVGGLNAAKVFSWTGNLPQNVNYAIKSSYIFPLLDELEPSAAPAKEFELSRLAPLVQPSVVLIIAE